MDANTAIVLTGLVVIGFAGMALIVGALAALVRDALDSRVRPRPPARAPRPPRRKERTNVHPRPERARRPLSWEALEGK